MAWGFEPRPEARIPSATGRTSIPLRFYSSPPPVDPPAPLAGDAGASRRRLRVHDPPPTASDDPDLAGRHARRLQAPAGRGGVRGGHHADEADAHVEHAEHLVVGDPSCSLEEAEDARNRP